MKKDFSCAECKPADMPCQISAECKRQRRLEKDADSLKRITDFPEIIIPDQKFNVINETKTSEEFTIGYIKNKVIDLILNDDKVLSAIADKLIERGIFK